VDLGPVCCDQPDRPKKQQHNDINTLICPLNQTCAYLQPVGLHSFKMRHSNPHRASPRPASRPASPASLTAVPDDQQLEEVIVVAGHAGGVCLKPRAFTSALRLSPAERLAGTRLRSCPEKSPEFHPDRRRKQRVCRCQESVSQSLITGNGASSSCTRAANGPIRARRRHMT